MIDLDGKNPVAPAGNDLHAYLHTGKGDFDFCNLEGKSSPYAANDGIYRNRPYDQDIPHMCRSSILYDLKKDTTIVFAATVTREQVDQTQLFYLLEMKIDHAKAYASVAKQYKKPIDPELGENFRLEFDFGPRGPGINPDDALKDEHLEDGDDYPDYDEDPTHHF